MTDQLREAALRAFVWQTIEARAKALKDAARDELKAIPVGERVTAKWGDQILAKASMNKGAAKLVITDQAKLTEWVRVKHPSELVASVNPAYVKSLEMTAKTVGAVIDDQGELVPGVELRASDPAVSVRKEPDVDSLAVVAELLSGGHFRLDAVKALEAE